VDLVTDANAPSIPPHVTAAQVTGLALAACKMVLGDGVGKLLEMARANLATSRVPPSSAAPCLGRRCVVVGGRSPAGTADRTSYSEAALRR
jgi:hypothetical protein